MDISEIVKYALLGVAGLATVVEVTPIKISPWSALAKLIGNKLNADITEKLEEQSKTVGEIKSKTDALEGQLEQKDAEDARNHILRFGDEVKNHVRHSEEYFNQILADITKYEHYCQAHLEFQNARTVATKNIILKVYQKCVEENDFL